jgi:hypothetical protein
MIVPLARLPSPLSPSEEDKFNRKSLSSSDSDAVSTPTSDGLVSESGESIDECPTLLPGTPTHSPSTPHRDFDSRPSTPQQSAELLFIRPRSDDLDECYAAHLLLELGRPESPPKRSRTTKLKDEEAYVPKGSSRRSKKHAHKDVRIPNSCEMHKRRHLKCPLDCAERLRREQADDREVGLDQSMDDDAEGSIVPGSPSYGSD